MVQVWPGALSWHKKNVRNLLTFTAVYDVSELHKISKSTAELNTGFKLNHDFRDNCWMFLCLLPLTLHSQAPSQGQTGSADISAYTAKTLRCGKISVSCEMSRPCGGVAAAASCRVDPSLAQQHLEEPRRPCNFSEHQQFTIRAATATNSVLLKNKRHQIIQSLTVGLVSSSS